MKEKLTELIDLLKKDIQEIKNEADYLNIKSKYLGKKSDLSSLMSSIKKRKMDLFSTKQKHKWKLF